MGENVVFKMFEKLKTFVTGTIVRIVLFYLAYTQPILISLLAIPLFSFWGISRLSAKFNKKLGAPLSPESGFTCVDDYYGAPTHNVVGLHYTDKPIKRATVIKRMQEIIDTGRFPELTQQLTRWMGFYYWGQCGNFNLENQIKECEFSGKMTVRDVQQYQDHLSRKGFVKDNPLWEIYLFPKFVNTDGGSAFALRVHHTLADGYAELSLLNAIGGVMPPEVSSKTPWSWEWFQGKVKKFIELIPLQYDFVRAFFLDFDFNVWIKPKEERAEERHFHESHDLTINLVKAVSKRIGVSGSDILMAALAKAVREELSFNGEPIPRKMSAIFPMFREGHSGGLTNHAVLNSLLIPVGEEDRLKRVERVKEDMSLKRKISDLVYRSTCFFGVVQQFTMWSPQFGPYCTMAVTNFVLPSKPWNLFGATVVKTSFSYEISLHVPLAVMFIGYRDRISVWVKGRKDVIRSEERAKAFVQNIIAEVEALAQIEIGNGKTD